MASLNLGKIKFVNKGEYNNTATYTHGDVVTYEGTSFVYKSNTSTTGAPLFLNSYSGTANISNSQSTITIVWSDSIFANIALNPVVENQHYLYSEYFEPGTKIIRVNSKTPNTWNVTLSTGAIKNFGNTTNNISVTASSRRVGNRTELTINNNHWDLLSEGMNYKGNWNSANTYIEGDIVTYGNTDAYICVANHTNMDPLWDYIGVWENFSIGEHRKPQYRARIMSSNPEGWRGHPYVPCPNWGTANTYTGIPWTLDNSIKNSIHAHRWNEPTIRAYSVYRGEACFYDASGRGIGHGGAGYYGLRAYKTFLGEVAAHHVNDYYTERSRQYGNKTFDQTKKSPLIMQGHQAWSGHFYLHSNGQLTAFGNNDQGELGQGTYDGSDLPIAFDLGSRFFGGRKIVKISVPGKDRNGSTTQMALDEYGEVWVWGYNGYFELGVVGDTHNTANVGHTQTIASGANANAPIKLPKELRFDGRRIVDIFASYYSSYALDEEGDLWAWGYNNYGQLGFPTNAGFNNANYSKAPYKIPINWSTYGGIQKVVLGLDSYNSTPSFWVLDGQGHIWNCGYNGNGNLGRGNTTSDTNASTITRTSATASWTIGGSIKNFWLTNGGNYLQAWFLDTNNRLWGVGYNAHRILSTNSTTNQTLPVQAYGPKGEMKNIVTVATIFSAGGGTAFAIDEDNVAYSAGWNALGEAGLGHASYTDITTGSTRNASSGTDTGASWQRVFLPNTWVNKVVDVCAFGDYEGTAGYGHSAYTYWLNDRGELLQCGEQGPASARQINYGTNTYILNTPISF